MCSWSLSNHLMPHCVWRKRKTRSKLSIKICVIIDLYEYLWVLISLLTSIFSIRWHRHLLKESLEVRSSEWQRRHWRVGRIFVRFLTKIGMMPSWKAYWKKFPQGPWPSDMLLKNSVPRSTLGDCASGRVVPRTKSGAPTYLSPEEKELVQFLIGSADIGYPKSVWEVRALVGAILSRNADSDVGCVSTGWWKRFKKWHPNLSLHQEESLAYKRVIATNRDVIDKYRTCSNIGALWDLRNFFRF